MSGLMILVGVIYIIYKLCSEASQPTLKGEFDFRKWNDETHGKGYSAKQLNKMMNTGRYHK